MPFNLLLLPLIGGFVFLAHWRFTLYFAKRLDKERLLLYSSLAGALLLGVSFGISILVVSYPDRILFGYLLRLRNWWAYNTPPFGIFRHKYVCARLGNVSSLGFESCVAFVIALDKGEGGR